MTLQYKGHTIYTEALIPEGGGAPVRWYLALVDGEPLLSQPTEKATARSRTFRSSEAALRAAKRHIDDLVAPRSIAECSKCRGYLPLLSPPEVAAQIDALLADAVLWQGSYDKCDDYERARHNTEKLIVLKVHLHHLRHHLLGICGYCTPSNIDASDAKR